MPPLLDIVNSTRHILRKPKRSTHYRDLIKYLHVGMTGWLSVAVVDFVQDVVCNRPLLPSVS